MADARDMDLPLATVEGGGVDNPKITHDWHYLFGQLGLLDYDKTIGLMTRGLGSVTMIFAIATGTWIISHIYLENRKS